MGAPVGTTLMNNVAIARKAAMITYIARDIAWHNIELVTEYMLMHAIYVNRPC